MNKFEYDLFKECASRWGNTSQILMMLEEMNEFGVELLHHLRSNKPHDKERIKEELADVKLMLDQIQYIFKINDDELEYYRILKIERLQKLLEVEKRTDQFLDKKGGNIFG